MAANTTFRTYHGSFTQNAVVSDPSGVSVATTLVGTIDGLQANEAGMVTGSIGVDALLTVVLSAPGRPGETAMEPYSESEFFSGSLYDFVVAADTFSTSQAKVSYSFQTSGAEIVLRFETNEIIPSFAVAPGVFVSGTGSFNATLTAAYNASQPVHSQTFQSLLPTNVFTGWSGTDTVEYSHSRGRVIADLQSGSGINAFGGSDTFIGIENLTGSNFNDMLAGNAENNLFIGGAGDDNIVGRLGLDVAEFAGLRTASTVAKAGATTIVTGAQGIDTLEGVERLQFSDRGLAFDLNVGEAAGNTVRIIGAAFGGENINADLAGIGIDLFDAGLTAEQVSQLALGTPLFMSLAGSRSNIDFVNTVYRNVVGVLPSAPERDYYVGLLQGSGGTMTQAELLVLAANSAANESSIDLVGLQQSGLEFV